VDYLFNFVLLVVHKLYIACEIMVFQNRVIMTLESLDRHWATR